MMKHSLWTYTAFFLAAFAATAPCARADTWNFDEVRVGQIFVAETQSKCGGSLIGADLVLTAAHCVTRKESSEPVDFRSVSFSLTDAEGNSRVYQAGDIATDPLFVREAQATREQIGRDIALVRLTEDASDASVLEEMGAFDSSQSFVALLPADKADPFAAEPCEASFEDDRIVVLSCTRAKGSSGSPAFSLLDGHRKVVAVISANGTRDEKPVTFAVNPLAALADLRWIGKIRPTPSSF